MFKAVTTLQGNTSVPDELTDACGLYRSNRHQGLQDIDRYGLRNLIRIAADRHATCCETHVRTNYTKWLLQWLVVRAFWWLGGFEWCVGFER